jgi:hypothetical protein
MKRGLSRRLLQRFHSRSRSRIQGELEVDFKNPPTPTLNGNTLPARSMSRREKIVHVIANPDTLFKHENSKPEVDSR